MISDNDNRDIIRGTKDASYLDKSLFISAGAGAGKTTLIVDRITELLKNGKAVPSEIVVITFTNAAAAELRSRLSDRLRELKLEDYRIDDMTISTIHAFCHQLVNMRSFDAGIGLSSELVEEADADIYKENYYDKYINDNFFDSDITDLRELIGKSFYSGIKKRFIDIADREGVHYTASNKIMGMLSLDDLKREALKVVPSIIKRIALSEAALAGVKHSYSTFKTGVDDGIKTVLQQIEKDADIEAAYEALNTVKSSYTTKRKKTFNENVKINKDKIVIENDNLREEYKRLLKPYLALVEAFKAWRLQVFLNKVVDAYQKERDKNKLTNDSLLYAAARLTESPDAVRFFKEKYKYYFVDEYQDTDDKQMQIIWNLTSGFVTGKEKGGLVVVGDEKQSIYRFRGADTVNFERMKAKMLTEGSSERVIPLELTTNYRSNKSIIDWVNDIFGYRFVSKFGHTYENMQVSDLRASYSGDVLEGVYCAEGNSPEAVCALIENLVKSGKKIAYKKRVKVTENGEETEREEYSSKDIDYSDIMILTQSKYNHPVYAEMLKQHDIPVSVYGKVEDEASKKAIQSFKIFIDYLDSPYDQLKKGVLIQLLSGDDYLSISKEDLLEYYGKIKNIRRYLRGFNAVQVAGYFQKHLELIMPQGENVSPHQFIEVQKFYDALYEKILTSDIQSLKELSLLIDDYISSPLERIAEMKENRNAVFITNMHKAKGLQSPIVIIADRNGWEDGTNQEDYIPSSYKEGNDYYEVILINNYKGKTLLRTFADNPTVIKNAKEADQLDILRLSYVAATRAKELLIYMTPDDEDINGCYMGNITDDLPSIEDELWVDGQDDTVTEPLEAQEGEEPNSNDYIIKTDDILCGENTEISKKIYLTMNPSGMEHRESGDVCVGDETRPRGNVFGTVMHRCFELLVVRRNDVSQAPDEEKGKIVDAVIIQALLESYQDLRTTDKPDVFATYLKEKMQEFLNSKLFSDVIAADEVYPEYSFSYTLYGKEADDLIETLELKGKSGYEEFVEYEFSQDADESTGKLWINGIADLVLKKDGNVSIIDYKSDSIIYEKPEKPEEDKTDDSADKDEEKKERRVLTSAEFKDVLLKRYTGQLELYKAAISRLMNVDENKISYELYSMYEES